jgi:hypothetical protein
MPNSISSRLQCCSRGLARAAMLAFVQLSFGARDAIPQLRSHSSLTSFFPFDPFYFINSTSFHHLHVAFRVCPSFFILEQSIIGFLEALRLLLLWRPFNRARSYHLSDLAFFFLPLLALRIVRCTARVDNSSRLGSATTAHE